MCIRDSIQIARQGYREGRTRAPETFLIEEPENLRQTVIKEPGVQLTLARLGFTGVINNGKRDLGIIGEGVEPAAEAKLGTFLRYMEGRALADSDSDGIVLGQGVAKSLGLKAGDRVNLVTVSYTHLDVYKRQALRLPILVARKLMKVNGSTSWVVLLDKTEQTAEAAGYLASVLPAKGFEIVPWNTLADFYNKTVVLFSKQVSVVKFIIGLIIVLTISNTCLLYTSRCV